MVKSSLNSLNLNVFNHFNSVKSSATTIFCVEFLLGDELLVNDAKQDRLK